MKRKILQLGHETQAITIPREFSVENELKKGDFLEVDVINDSLIITNSNQDAKKINLDVTNLTVDLIWRHLVTAYRKGIATIVVKYSDKDLNVIQNFAKDLVGMSITKQKENTIVIRDIFDKQNIDIKKTMIRIFNLLLEESEETYNALQHKKVRNLQNINLLDYNINKFTNLCLRTLNKYGFYHHESVLSLYKIISLLEEIGDEYRRIASIHHRMNKQLDKYILGYVQKVNYLLKEYYELFGSYDKEKIIEFYEKANILLLKLKQNYTKRKPHEIQIISGLDTILHLIKSLIEENFVLSL